MSAYLDRSGLKVSPTLVGFVEHEALPGAGIEPAALWSGLADILAHFAPHNRALLDTRDTMQAKIDDWHKARAGQPQERVAIRGAEHTQEQCCAPSRWRAPRSGRVPGWGGVQEAAAVPGTESAR